MTLRKTAHGEVLETSADVDEQPVQHTASQAPQAPGWTPTDEHDLETENRRPGPNEG